MRQSDIRLAIIVTKDSWSNQILCLISPLNTGRQAMKGADGTGVSAFALDSRLSIVFRRSRRGSSVNT